jgi:capsid protein
VAYHVLGPTPDQDEYISARDLIQVFDPRWADQIRGFPVFMHALLDLKDLRQIQGYEKIAAELMSSIGILEWNEQGAPDLDPASVLRGGTQFVGSNPLPAVTVEQIPGGGNIKYMRSQSGSKIEQLKNERPSVQLDAFMDRLIRNACVGAGWPFELTWDASKLGGANVRLLIAKAMRAVEDRQDLLRPVAKRCVGYATAKAIKSGILEGFDDWYNWGFGMPARMTTDYGRDSKADLADLEAGVTNLDDILHEEGKDLDQHIAKRKAINEKLIAAGLPPIGPKAAAPIDNEDDENEGPEGEAGAPVVTRR